MAQTSLSHEPLPEAETVGLLDEAFGPLLRHHIREDLDAHDAAIYGLWPDLKLAYMNPAWSRFAADNDGEPRMSSRWGLGASLLDAIAPVLKGFYRDKLRACLRDETVWSHDYECSSPDRIRRFRQWAYPLEGRQGLLIVNALVVDLGRSRPKKDGRDPETYRDGDGLLHQCSHCRRVMDPTQAQRWDWVPRWAAEIPAGTSHTLCPSCFGHYFRLPA